MDVVGDKIFIIGGVGRYDYTNMIYEINPKNKSIKSIDMEDWNGPDVMAFHKTIRYGEKIIVYGG